MRASSSDPATPCLPESDILWISENRAANLATVSLAYETTSAALKLHARGDFDQPLKPYVRPGGRADEHERGRLLSMPAFLGGDHKALGVKLMAGFPVNIDKGLPRAAGLIALFDPVTGVPVAILSCQTISARRTAAVASICVDYLAANEPLRVAILGAGPIAHETIISLLLSRPRQVDLVSIYDPRSDRAEALAQLIAPNTETLITTAASARLCVSGANVIIAATTGAKDYIQLDWLSGPWLVVALSHDDFRKEVMLSADKLIVDDFDQCNREEMLFGHLVQSGALARRDVYAELGEIVSGMKAGREARERVFVNPMGMAIEDIALANGIYRIVKDSDTDADQILR